jgi:hypothetical protein
MLQKIWANKKSNGLKAAKTYLYRRTRNLHIGLSNIDSLQLQSWLKKDFGHPKENY